VGEGGSERYKQFGTVLLRRHEAQRRLFGDELDERVTGLAAKRALRRR
jgi:hypothetical protein